MEVCILDLTCKIYTSKYIITTYIINLALSSEWERVFQVRTLNQSLTARSDSRVSKLAYSIKDGKQKWKGYLHDWVTLKLRKLKQKLGAWLSKVKTSGETICMYEYKQQSIKGLFVCTSKVVLIVIHTHSHNIRINACSLQPLIDD